MTKIFFLPMFMLLVSFAGCSKDDADEPQQPTPVASTCQLTEALSYQNNKLARSRVFEYDASTKNLAKQIHTIYNTSGVVTAVLTYAYSYPTASSVVISGTDKYGFVSKSTISLNDKKLATHIRLESNESGTTWEQESFEYNGEQLVKSKVTKSNGLETEFGYEWSNGNMIRKFLFSDNSTQVEWEYYTDQDRRKMDAIALSDLASYRWETIRNKNQVKGIKGSRTYTYTYDGNDETNKMADLLFSNNLTTDWTFKYVNCQ
ncbi:hypothetical protein ACFSQD_13645 [Flavihumibacter stibioxidans]|uniref:YD repeat-containing protein n=1 Tax=Flavihumibacter stibioxidans TaxID=1834163 RepID=A0ABR7M8R6_9BACT|nr:hypothetical protein [Flavihumibacter stibioxidans]MBC6491357.1 hypothetical protein [Flavihumibacter stibioxidans]